MKAHIRWPRVIVASIIALLFLGVFTALGIWQVQRLGWKLDLIERVDARVAAPPVPSPGPQEWPSITAAQDEYRHVELRGTFLNDEEVQIYTPSSFGPSYWILTPLQRDDGTVVMVNRGLVPEDRKDPADHTTPDGPQEITGLLRLTEDKGWLFSQDNRPEDGVWYRRDISSITATKGLQNAAPYFVDQDMTDPRGFPRGGQTVVKFRNSHLSYAITWFALALLSVAGWAVVLRAELRRDPRDS